MAFLRLNRQKLIVIVCHGTGREHVAAPATFGLPIAYRYMRLGYIPADAACIAYTSPNSSINSLNFGQTYDQECLATVVAATADANPQADIIILSCCNGAATTMNYVALYNDPQNYKQKIKAIIVESPFSHAMRVADHIGQRLFWWPFSTMPALALRLFVASHSANAPTLFDAIKNIPPHIAMLICALPNDHLTPYQDSKNIAGTVLKNGYKALFCTFPDCDEDGQRSIEHGHLSRETDFLWLHHAFLASHGLEHTPDLAQKGTDIFTKALSETRSLTTY